MRERSVGEQEGQKEGEKPRAKRPPRALAWAAACVGIAVASLPVGRPAHASPNPTLTLALKFIEFERDGKPVLTRDQALKVVEGINSVYAQCGMRLRLERYEQVDPLRFGFRGRFSSPDEMDGVRTPFDTERYLVVIHTDAWDHGPMGPANAWTSMPGQTPSGAVLEAPVASNDNVTAHELGHYLGLDHAHDESELMNPIIYHRSIRITPEQCRQMRSTALAERAGALRDA